MEAAHLGLFMLSACAFTTLLYHPGSPIAEWFRGIGNETLRRLAMGAAMALTAATIVYSPWGRRSGAHFNPVVTVTFWRLGKVAGWDAAGYIVAQFLGGFGGVLVARAWLGGLLGDPAVQYAVTRPGPAGPVVALGAETAISFGLMLVVLVVSNSRAAGLTGVAAAALVATYITIESPLSGMSMNPARTVASALPAGSWTAAWVYFTGPLLGMLIAADVYLRLARGRAPVCAKLCHAGAARCIFRCGYVERGRETTPSGARGSAAMVGVVGLLAVVAFVTPVVVAQPARAETAGRVRAVGAIGLTVSDLARSVAFYRDVLGFEEEARREVAGPAFEASTGLAGARARVAVMRLGEERLELTEFETPRGRPAPPDSRSNDGWFQHVAIVTSDIEQGHLWLTRHGARPVSPAPQRLPDWNPAAAGIKAFYFRDPDGHPLELIEFPPDKGDPRWRRSSDGIFLGIDHTAIVVRDTTTSLRFYQDVLGLRVAGESMNWGPEQERLNDVVGARLRITTLRAPAGPGVELLEYLEPRTGRPAPADTGVNDLVHWHTTVLLDGDGVLGGGGPPERLARDPDRHVLRVIGLVRGKGPVSR